MAIAVLLTAALMTPAIRTWAGKNKRATWIGGIVALTLAVCVLVVGLAFPVPGFSPELAAGTFSVLMLVGLSLFQLPNASASVERALDAQKVAARIRPTLGGFHPLDEVKGTYAYLWRNKVPLAEKSEFCSDWALRCCPSSLHGGCSDPAIAALREHWAWVGWP
jgi:hypothetical protein